MAGARYANRLGVLTASIAAFAGGDAAFGDEASDETVVDEIVVTGSHIRQMDREGPSPVVVVDREALLRRGVPTVGQAMERLPFGNDGSFNDTDALSSAIGGSGVSIRGLGANAVLILINGRRVAPYGFTFASDTYVSFVDLNTIPISAVERIEVLRDGASAIYGSDAIGGVINIVLREFRPGLEFEGRIGQTSESGADERSVSAAYGFSTTAAEVQTFFSYQYRNHLYWRDRDTSRTSNFEDRGGFDVRVIEAANYNIFDDGNWLSFGAECEARNATLPGGNAFEEIDGTCVYDPNVEMAEPLVERTGLLTTADIALGAGLGLHVEASYQRTELDNRTNVYLYTGDYYPVENPWNPFPAFFAWEDGLGNPVLPYAYAFTETGPRLDALKTDSIRGVAALEGKWGTWLWELGMVYHVSETSRDARSGYLSAENIKRAVAGIDLNRDGELTADEYWNIHSPFTNPNSPELAATLEAPRYRESTTTLASLTGLLSVKVADLPNGPLLGAYGFEMRRGELDDISDQLPLDQQLAKRHPPLYWGIRFDDGDVSVGHFTTQELDESFSPTSQGTRTQYSIFGELQIPILENLDVQAAARFEHYSDFGSDVNPRIAARFQPLEWLTLRASWGQSFRAPSLVELNLGSSAETVAAWDPVRCPAYSFVKPPAVACVLTQTEHVVAGNPNLQPEEAETLSFGFTLAPLPGISIAANAWEVQHANRIVLPGVDKLIINESILPEGMVVRAPPDESDVAHGTPGQFQRLNDRFMNVADMATRGVDLDVDLSFDLGGWGVLGSTLRWTHIESREYQFSPDEEVQQTAGAYGVPENRAAFDLFLDTADWQFDIFGRWTDGYDDPYIDSDVASHVEWDLQISNYSLNTVRVTLGVQNLFNNTPPFAGGYFNPQGFNNQFYRMRGRMVYGRLTINL